MPLLQYPFDATGLASTNLIPDEQHAVTDANFRDFHFVVPHFAPFFAEGLVVKHYNLDEVKTLAEGIDYYPVLQYIGATRSIGKAVYGGVALNNTFQSGIVGVTYQALGGEWTANRLFVLERLAEKVYNPRLTIWDNVTNKTDSFPPIDHNQAYGDMLGQKELIEAIVSTGEKIVNNRPLLNIVKHLLDKNNPHEVSAAQVGLDLVKNFTIATSEEALNGVSNELYITPHTLNAVVGQKQLELDVFKLALEERLTGIEFAIQDHVGNNGSAHGIDSRDSSLIDTINRLDSLDRAFGDHYVDNKNPHRVTKSQVELDKASNTGKADISEVVEKTSVDKFITLEQLLLLLQNYNFGGGTGGGGTVVGDISYNLTCSSTLVNEGETVDFTVNTSNAPDGTELYWSIVNDSTSLSDFTASSGSVTLFANTARFSVSTFVDPVDEPIERFAVRLRTVSPSGNIVALSPSIDVENVSSNSSFNITADTTTIAEGGVVNFAIDTTNVRSGATVYWSIAHTTTSDADFSRSNGAVQVINNAASVTVNVAVDLLNEHDEQFKLQLRLGSISGSIVAESQTIVITQTIGVIDLMGKTSLMSPGVPLTARSMFIIGSRNHGVSKSRFTTEPLPVLPTRLASMVDLFMAISMYQPRVGMTATSYYLVNSKYISRNGFRFLSPAR